MALGTTSFLGRKRIKFTFGNGVFRRRLRNDFLASSSDQIGLTSRYPVGVVRICVSMRRTEGKSKQDVSGDDRDVLYVIHSISHRTRVDSPPRSEGPKYFPAIGIEYA